jgi:hypothetical protein
MFSVSGAGFILGRDAAARANPLGHSWPRLSLSLTYGENRIRVVKRRAPLALSRSGWEIDFLGRPHAISQGQLSPDYFWSLFVVVHTQQTPCVRRVQPAFHPLRKKVWLQIGINLDWPIWRTIFLKVKIRKLRNVMTRLLLVIYCF